MAPKDVERLEAALADGRSRRVVFVSHCLLNENVRYFGGAARPGGVSELVSRLQDAGIGICQMPCPEQRAWGGVRKRFLRPMYGSNGTLRYRLRRPLTWAFLAWSRLVYAGLARRVAHDIADYRRSGFEVVGVIGVGASPSCGVFRTLDVARSLEVMASCQAGSMDAAAFNTALMGAALTTGSGYFTTALRRSLERRGLDVELSEHDLVAELEDAGLLRSPVPRRPGPMSLEPS